MRLTLSAAGQPIYFFDLEPPAQTAKDPALGRTIKEWHDWVGTAGYWLTGLHAAGAFHHLVSRDHPLIPMLPGRS